MIPANFTLKSTALITGMSLLAVTVLPANTAFAHDRHNPARHGGYHMTKKEHRQFHRKWGRGNHGTQAYHAHQSRKVRKKSRRNNNGELIAAGIIGLAIGAIIAGESSKRRQHKPAPVYQPYPQHNPYHDQGYRYGSDNPHGVPVPLNDYQTQPSVSNDPHVITFDETASLEPWTAGWREWCINRYRSFNPQTGTFRGYDGLDHFCVPK